MSSSWIPRTCLLTAWISTDIKCDFCWCLQLQGVVSHILGFKVKGGVKIRRPQAANSGKLLWSAHNLAHNCTAVPGGVVGALEYSSNMSVSTGSDSSQYRLSDSCCTVWVTAAVQFEWQLLYSLSDSCCTVWVTAVSTGSDSCQ